jgi:hypothetical protein
MNLWFLICLGVVLDDGELGEAINTLVMHDENRNIVNKKKIYCDACSNNFVYISGDLICGFLVWNENQEKFSGGKILDFFMKI